MIFGLTGYAGAGKDTAADYLVAKHGFTRVAFADKLREFCLKINPDIHSGFQEEPYFKLADLVNDVGWDSAKRNFMDVREFLQRVGHGARVAFGDLFWIEHALTPEVLSNDRLVVTDVRYQNEVDYIVGLDGFIVRIDREDVGPVNNHITEQPLPFDYKLNNPKGNKMELYANLNDLVLNLSKITA